MHVRVRDAGAAYFDQAGGRAWLSADSNDHNIGSWLRSAFDPKQTSYEALLKAFWEGHDPTQGMRQGNDVGTQYRSGIYVANATQRTAAEASKAAYENALGAAGYDKITTEILDAPTFYYAEDYHQQYLQKNPGGYCGLGGTHVSCPGLNAAE